MSNYPKAQAAEERVTVQPLGDELVIYDLDRDLAHALNPTAAAVWRWCDGQTSEAEMAQRLAGRAQIDEQAAQTLVAASLERLHAAQLMVSPASAQRQVTRRQMLRMAGGAALLPVVYTLAAPSAAQAQSCTPNDGSCTQSSECCSNCCKDVGGGLRQCKPGGGNCLP